MKIGLPKALLYYRYTPLWKAFFNELNIDIIESNDTTAKTLILGKEKSIDEACLALKIYLGHIEELKDKCDYILVPRIFSLTKDEQVCTNFNALYDIVRNTFPDIKILNYNIDVKHHHSEKSGFIKIGRELGFSIIETSNAYNKAKKIEKDFYKNEEKKAKEELRSNKTKILLLGHPYILKDNLIGKSIINYLEKNNISIIYSYQIPRDLIDFNCSRISTKIHFTMNKEYLAAFNYFKDKVDGTIILTAFPCGPDSLSNEMIIRKRKKHPTLLLTFEDLTNNTAVITRLESFLDMLKGGIHL